MFFKKGLFFNTAAKRNKPLTITEPCLNKLVNLKGCTSIKNLQPKGGPKLYRVVYAHAYVHISLNQCNKRFRLSHFNSKPLNLLDKNQEYIFQKAVFTLHATSLITHLGAGTV